MAFTQDFRSQRRNYADGHTRLGELDRLWYDHTTNTIRVGDDTTPGGRAVAVSATAITSSTTTLLVDHSTPQIIPGMTATPSAGTYIVNYNSKFLVVDTSSITALALADVTALYNDLSARTVTGTETVRNPNATTYADEELDPGVYIQAGAITVNGTLTLNAGGNADAEFIFITAGAFSTGAGAEIVLSGGATSSNVWFVCAGAPSTGVNTIFRGNFLADQAAPSLGAPTAFEGRMLAVNGAIAIGAASTITAPTGDSATSIGSLTQFNLFTGSGAVSNTGSLTTVALSVGTNLGAVTGFDGEDQVSGSIIPGGATAVSRVRVGVYIDGVLIPDSRRAYTHPFADIDDEYAVVLQTVATMTAGQTVDVRAGASFGKLSIGPRMSMTLLPIA